MSQERNVISPGGTGFETAEGVTGTAAKAKNPSRYKWIALSNTTIGILMVTISGSITLISLPDIFDGIHLNPLQSGNTSYFLWLLMGFLLVTAVLVVSLGRVGDMYGRVKMYNLGFAIFTLFSILLSVTWMTGHAGALWLIIMRIFQGVGGAFLFANSSAIITDAFPEDERGLALGINGVAAISGSFIGLLVGGILAPIEWRLVFLVCVPFGLFGTVWAYLKLVDNGVRIHAKIDWWGNVTFAVGLISLLTGIVYAIQPYGGHTMGWTNPGVDAAIAGGILTLVLFGWIERRVTDPMFRLPLFRIRAFAAGNIANLLAALGRGGLQFMLIIWLQGIWLPQHGYSFTQTPLWAGIYMIPLTVGFLVAGPISGILSDRYGARPFATGGMIGAAIAFFLLEVLPINFGYVWFALILLLMGLAMGLFSSPNRAGVMNSLPPDQRGAGAGMMTTFQNAAQVLSIGIFFTVITLGLAASLPTHLYSGLIANGVPSGAAHTVANEPPIGALFGAFLGLDPIKQLLPQTVLAHLTATQQATLTGRSFFPKLITAPFGTGLHYAFDFAIGCSLVAAVASWLRGKRYVHGMDAAPALAGAVGFPDEERTDDRITGAEISDAPVADEAAPVLAAAPSVAGAVGGGSAHGRAPGGDVLVLAGGGDHAPADARATVTSTPSTTNGHAAGQGAGPVHATNGHGSTVVGNGTNRNGSNRNGTSGSGSTGSTGTGSTGSGSTGSGSNGSGSNGSGSNDTGHGTATIGNGATNGNGATRHAGGPADASVHAGAWPTPGDGHPTTEPSTRGPVAPELATPDPVPAAGPTPTVSVVPGVARTATPAEDDDAVDHEATVSLTFRWRSQRGRSARRR